MWREWEGVRGCGKGGGEKDKNEGKSDKRGKMEDVRSMKERGRCKENERERKMYGE